MKRILTLIAILVLTTTLGMAQEKYTQPGISGRISITGPHLGMELATSQKSSIYAGFWTGINFESEFYFTPEFTVEPRYYFNLDSRAARGKRIDNFSAWFLSFPLTMQFPEMRFNLGPAIGFQRTLGRMWYFNIRMGPALSYYDDAFHTGSVSNLSFGLLLK